MNLRTSTEIKADTIVRYKPNAVTQAAILEAEQLLKDPNAKTFTSMEALRADLLSDEDDDV
jgi:hypothetical protein